MKHTKLIRKNQMIMRKRFDSDNVNSKSKLERCVGSRIAKLRAHALSCPSASSLASISGASSSSPRTSYNSTLSSSNKSCLCQSNWICTSLGSLGIPLRRTTMMTTSRAWNAARQTNNTTRLCCVNDPLNSLTSARINKWRAL